MRFILSEMFMPNIISIRHIQLAPTSLNKKQRKGPRNKWAPFRLMNFLNENTKTSIASNALFIQK